MNTLFLLRRWLTVRRSSFSSVWLVWLLAIITAALIVAKSGAHHAATPPPLTQPTPTISGFSTTTSVTAGDQIEIYGQNLAVSNGIAPEVLFTGGPNLCDPGNPTHTPATADVAQPVTTNQLIVLVPRGAATGPVTVRHSGGTAVRDITVNTSISGIVCNAANDSPLGGVSIIVPPPLNTQSQTPHTVNSNTTVTGAFVVPLSFSGSRIDFEVNGSNVGFGTIMTSVFVQPDSDNQHCGVIKLFQGGGMILSSRYPPVSLPVGTYSSRIFRAGAAFTPSGWRNLPNSDHLPAGSQVHLLRLDKNRSSATFGQFVDVGPASVQSAHVRVNDAALTRDDYFFVSARYQTVTLRGRVREFGGQSVVRRALVMTRGQYAFTDNAGEFVLQVPVLNSNEIIVEVKISRPDGKVELKRLQTQLANNPPLLTITMRRHIIQPPVQFNLPMEIIIQQGRLTRRQLPVLANTPATLPGPHYASATQVTVTGAQFASIRRDGNGNYTLQLNPKSQDRGEHTLVISTRGPLGTVVNQQLKLRVE